MNRLLLGLAVIAAALLVGSGYLLASATSNAEDLAQQIQRERARNIRENCADINHRHDNTIRTLDTVIASLPPSRRAQAREGRASTVLLLDAIVPKRDCAELVRQSVGVS